MLFYFICQISDLYHLKSGAETNMSLLFSLISTNESFLQEQTLGLVHHDIMTDTMVHDTWHHTIDNHGSWYMASRYISGFMIHDIIFNCPFSAWRSWSKIWMMTGPRLLVFLSPSISAAGRFATLFGLTSWTWSWKLKLRPAWKGWGCCTKAGRGL